MAAADEGDRGEQILHIISGYSVNGEAPWGSTTTRRHRNADGTHSTVHYSLSGRDEELLETMRNPRIAEFSSQDITRITFRTTVESDCAGGTQRLEVAVFVEANQVEREQAVGMLEETPELQAIGRIEYHAALPFAGAEGTESTGISAVVKLFQAEGEEVVVIREQELLESGVADHARGDSSWLILRAAFPLVDDVEQVVEEAEEYEEEGWQEEEEREEVVVEEVAEEEEEREEGEETLWEEEAEEDRHAEHVWLRDEETEELVEERMRFVARYVCGAKRRKLQEVAEEHCGTMREEETCSICLSEMMVGEEVVCTPCFHQFHDSCIRRWFENARCCPLCRFEIDESGHV